MAKSLGRNRSVWTVTSTADEAVYLVRINLTEQFELPDGSI